MSDDRSDELTMIGLHQLAPETAARCVPALGAPPLSRDSATRAKNIIEFPREATRPPGDIPVAVFGRDAASGRNVVAFAPPPGKTWPHSCKA